MYRENQLGWKNFLSQWTGNIILMWFKKKVYWKIPPELEVIMPNAKAEKNPDFFRYAVPSRNRPLKPTGNTSLVVNSSRTHKPLVGCDYLWSESLWNI